MVISALTNLLTGFGEKHSAREPDFANEDVAGKYVHGKGEEDKMQFSLSDAFSKAENIVDYLCYPVQLVYPGADGKGRYRLGSMRAIRKDGDGDYIFRISCDLHGDTRFFRGSQFMEFYGGRTGELVRDLPAFVESFHRFSGGAYLPLRLQLHILLFIARVDGRLCNDEQRVIQRFIDRYCQDNQADASYLADYFKESFITYEIFKQAADEIDTLPKEDLIALVKSTRDMIEADGTVTAEEKRFFADLEDELGVIG